MKRTCCVTDLDQATVKQILAWLWLYNNVVINRSSCGIRHGFPPPCDWHHLFSLALPPPRSLRAARLLLPGELEAGRSEPVEVEPADDAALLAAVHPQTGSEGLVAAAVRDRVEARVEEVEARREGPDLDGAAVVSAAAAVSRLVDAEVARRGGSVSRAAPKSPGEDASVAQRRRRQKHR